MPTVNQDYLCVINVENGKTTFEKVDISQSTERLATLEQMTANPNRTVLDLQSQMNLAYSPGRRGYINYVSPYGYSSSYIAMTSYPSAITHEEYCGKLEKQAETIRTAFDGKNAEHWVDCAWTVAGKTGTAQKGEKITNDGIFMCYAPYDNPEVAVAIVVERGGAGANTQFMARQIIDAYINIRSYHDTSEEEMTLLR